MVSNGSITAGAYAAALRPGVLWKEIDLESIVWAPDAPAPVYLDPVDSVLASQLDGFSTNEVLVKDVCDIFGVDEEVANARLTRLVVGAANGGLLDLGDGVQPSHPPTHHLLPEPNW